MYVRHSLLTLLIVASGVVFAAPEKAQTASVTSRLEFVERLIESSSGAKQIDSNNNKSATARREEARGLYKQSQDAAKQGNDAKAHELLDQATKVMFEAVRMAGKKEVVKGIELGRYQDRLDSLNALCDAYDRIREEKNLGPAKDSELYPLVQNRRSDAEALKRENKVLEARKALDEAYAAAKVAIEHLRGGDTLVRSLNFATKEEEYHYEVDRNDTHKMLITVLAEQKVKSDPNKRKTVDSFVEKAAQIRTQAEARAGTGDFDAGVELLENSTKELVRAIRSVGIFIPG